MVFLKNIQHTSKRAFKELQDEIKSEQRSERIASFLKQNSLKILIIAFVVFIILRKDFSFHLNLTTPSKPDPQEETLPPAALPLPEEKAKSPSIKEKTITEKPPLPTAENKPSKGSVLHIYTAPASQLTAFQRLERVTAPMKKAYIKRFSRVSVDEMKRFGIPASITLAQAMLQSEAGTHQIAQLGSNHFQLNCDNWLGERMDFDNGMCFRKYVSPWRSFRDHSQFITRGKYAALKKLPRTDFVSWANELEELGFSTEKDYALQLIKTIQTYELNKLDY